MQEFIISTGEEQDHSEGVNSPSYAQGVITGDIPSNLPSVPLDGQMRYPMRKGVIVALIVICFMLATVSAFLGFLYFTPQKQDNLESENKIMGIQAEVPENNFLERKEIIPSSIKDKIFYTDLVNIFVADKDGDNKQQLTEYQLGEGDIEELELIDGETLGFFKCENFFGEFGCEIFRLNIKTKTISIVKSLDPLVLLLQLTWAGKEEYAYTIQLPREEKLVGRYINGEKEVQLFERKVSLSTRDWFIEDDSQLRFSPNSDKLYHIYTQAKSGFDFNIYIYDLEGNLMHEIQNATNPSWRTNDSIIYRNYSNDLSGYLYERVLSSNKASRIERSVEDAYGAKVSSGNLLYWEARGRGRSHIYEFDKRYNRLLMADAAFPVWLSEDEVIFARTRKCEVGECNSPGTLEYEVQFVVDAFYVKKLSSDEEVRIDLSEETLLNGVITWLNKHQ